MKNKYAKAMLIGPTMDVASLFEWELGAHAGACLAGENAGGDMGTNVLMQRLTRAWPGEVRRKTAEALVGTIIGLSDKRDPELYYVEELQDDGLLYCLQITYPEKSMPKNAKDMLHWTIHPDLIGEHIDDPDVLQQLGINEEEMSEL